MAITENKNSYFMIKVPVERNDKIYLDNIDDDLDLICERMSVKNMLYKIYDSNNIYCLFKTEKRKRKGQLNRFCAQCFPSEQEFYAEGLTKMEYEEKVGRLKRRENIEIKSEPSHFDSYQGQDIELFKDRDKWHKWQTEVYRILFNTDDKVRKADNRSIVNILDKVGNSGKSSFFKYLLFKHPSETGRLTYGTASQLRSAVVSIGAKPIYIIDLARTKSIGDKEEDILSTIEDIKSGVIVKLLYGSGDVLLMEPPHVIISSNYAFNYSLLSKDRWVTYEISKNDLSLKPIDPKEAYQKELVTSNNNRGSKRVVLKK